MDHASHGRIVSFIWNIADDVLRDVYVRGKYRDVILPMTVIRRLDCLLEPTKPAVLKLKGQLDAKGIKNPDAALRTASGQAFWNTSDFTLKNLLDSPKQLRQNFEAYLDGFSDNVKEIIDKFDFRNQLRKLADANVLFHLIEKYVDPEINLSPAPVVRPDGTKFPGLDNHSMGTVFEELIRKFNEDNNEEAGEHWTPRDVVRLMAHLIFEPIADQIQSGAYLLYDGACGTGGMLTVAEEVLRELAKARGKKASVHLFGQEINAETYAIAKADLLLKGEGAEADNIKYGSTLSSDGFPATDFDFMLSNPPYGKSWKMDLDRLCDGDKKQLSDPRFVVQHDGAELPLVTRSSDGQLMFLANMLSKMKRRTAIGSRIAEVHNGSSLFTGDAGQGESNIRRWLIENDWLEAIIALPENMFYNTGIATYIWVLTNRKPDHRKGKVQLIDATGWFRKLRKNMGQKNCEFSDDDAARILQTFADFKETDESKIFDNADFGYQQITVDRPLRLMTDASAPKLADFKKSADKRLHPAADLLAKVTGGKPQSDFNQVKKQFESAVDKAGLKLKPTDYKTLWAAFTVKDESAEPVSLSNHKSQILNPYEPDSDLRDTENVPLKEDVEAYFQREVKPYAADAWIDHSKTVIGFEVSFTPLLLQVPTATEPGNNCRGPAGTGEGDGWAAASDCGPGGGALMQGARRTSAANVPWLGGIPTHWRVVGSKRLFAQRKERARPDDQQLSATQAYGVIPQKEFEQRAGRRVVALMQHLEKRAHVERDDFVVSMRSFQGGLERAWAAGAIRSSYVVLKPMREGRIGYFTHLFKSHDYVRALQATSNFIRDGQDLSMRNFSLVDLPLPPTEEQNAIVAFLDRKLEEIDRFIAAKKRMIELLEEQKAAMIDRAVTKGLDPNTKMKPSGLAWLGDVPAGWRILRIRHLGRVGNGSTPNRGETKYWTGGTYPWLNSGVVNKRIVTSAEEFVTETALRECHLPKVPAQSVLLAITGQGKTRGMAALLLCEATINQHLAYIVPRRQAISPEYLHMVLRGLYAQLRAISDGEGSTKGALTCDDIKRFPLPVPPQAEQQSIVTHLAQMLNTADTAIGRTEREIDLMTEYRTALISDAVTGNINVSASVPVPSAAAQAATTPEPAKAARAANIHFKRSVFAAEIIHRLHQEPTFGHVKCEKLIFLCERRCGVETGSTYRRKAAGPYDSHALRSIDTQLAKNQWYAARKTGERYQYAPLAKAGGHQKYFPRYFADVEAEFSRIIDTFRTFDTVRCEIVATLYSAWEDLLADGQPATDDQIIEQVLEHWHPAKQRIAEDRWRKAIGWMRQQGFSPAAG